MPLPLYIVDAFADHPFRGNPAAICLLDHSSDPAWMQRVAAEMNLSETAFVHEERGRWRLRWFTPKAEVDLCGHATLAAAHTLWTEGMVDIDAPIAFDTRSGRLICNQRHGWIRMDFPAEPATPFAPPEALSVALANVTPAAAPLKNRFDLLVELASEDEIRRFTPNLPAIASLPTRGLIVTAKAVIPNVDFVSRFFAPALGVNEDPVTGSAHCCLGPYWAAKLAKSDLVAHQLSARGGSIRLQVQSHRVILSGQAVTVMRGSLLAG
jgi:PhzF family phenazine biosynthesis protein